MARSIAIGYSVAALCLVLGLGVSGCQDEPGETVVALEEVSAFSVPDAIHWDFVAGQGVECTEQTDPNVTAYPAFVSAQPLFGRVHLPREFHRGLNGRWYYFALDESSGTGRGYDRLYFDLNGNLDLTDDGTVGIWDDAPAEALARSSALQRQVCFDCLSIPLPFGAEATRPLEVMPRLVVYEDGDRYLTFVTTRAFRGETTIARKHFDVWLGHNRRISGWFDRPSTAVHLVREGDFDRREEMSANWLMEWRRIGGVDYYLSATPSGDRLTIRRYRGPYGTLKVSAGGRPLGRARTSGALYSGEALFWIGGRLKRSGQRKAVSSVRVPVGDYAAGLEIYLGDLHLSTGANIHADGRRDARFNDSPVLGVKIREDKPFVFDLSAPPEVLFASPVEKQHIARGQELRVEAVLLDPKLDLMVTDLERGRLVFDPPENGTFSLAMCGTGAGGLLACGLWLLSRRWRTRRRMLLILAGLTLIIALVPAAILYATNIEHRYTDISPGVTIARGDGEIVATGIMPFG